MDAYEIIDFIKNSKKMTNVKAFVNVNKEVDFLDTVAIWLSNIRPSKSCSKHEIKSNKQPKFCSFPKGYIVPSKTSLKEASI